MGASGDDGATLARNSHRDAPIRKLSRTRKYRQWLQGIAYSARHPQGLMSRLQPLRSCDGRCESLACLVVPQTEAVGRDDDRDPESYR
ncbi:MAG: hypothetical protein QOE41_2266 [Mycobacterium sp.]|jgi:hypothetical protein|nr:hypothetical protein [Mycobacterium sp.]